MEDEEERRMPTENERHQMEVIRELDMEELQIEIVDEDGTSDEDIRRPIISGHDQGTSPDEGVTFNTSLASMHTYLGEVDDTHGRVSFLDGGAILNLPMFYLEGVVLFPEAVLPLRVIQSEFKAAVIRALSQVDAPYTIGVVGVHRNHENGRLWFGNIGTTAEIRQYKRLNDGSLNVVARGQQRFRMRRRWIDVEGAPCAEVQIIEEDMPLRTPKDAFGKLASVCNLRRQAAPNPILKASKSNSHAFDDENDWESGSDTSPRSTYSSSPDIYGKYSSSPGSDSDFTFKHRLSKLSEELDKVGRTKGGHSKSGNSMKESALDGGKLEKEGFTLRFRKAYKAPLSFWPRWVYDMYDSFSLALRAADMWRHIIGGPNVDDFLNRPDILSFYIASRLPLSQSTRQELLEIDGISYRLQREIQLLERFNLIRCKNCRTLIAKRSDMLVMSSDGPLNAYVNPHGCVHEIMTLYNANGLVLHGSPIKEHSWFPGYAWTITSCSVCESHMGWLFTATNKTLRPDYFWGIRSSQVADDACQS